jgi:MFS family permease
MNTITDSKPLARSARLFFPYVFFTHFHFWTPIFIIYFASKFGMEKTLLLESIYFFSVFVLEVPSGYFSDRFGRKKTILIAQTCFFASYAMFAASNTFSFFVVAQILLAGGFAFTSGTDTSWHFDILTSLGQQKDYPRRESRSMRYILIGNALGALLGGLSGTYDIRIPYILSSITALISLAVILCMKEPPGDYKKSEPAVRFRKHLVHIFSDVRKNATLRIFFLFSVSFIVVNHLPYEFYQPYIKVVFADRLGDFSQTVSGFYLFATTLVSAFIAGRSHRIAEKFGPFSILLAALLIQVIILSAMAGWVHPVVFAILFLRALPRGLAIPIINSRVVPLIPSSRRATYLSVQSLAGRVAFSIVLLFLSAMAGGSDGNDLFAALRGAAGISMLVLVFVTGILALNSRRKKSREGITVVHVPRG